MEISIEQFKEIEDDRHILLCQIIDKHIEGTVVSLKPRRGRKPDLPHEGSSMSLSASCERTQKHYKVSYSIHIENGFYHFSGIDVLLSIHGEAKAHGFTDMMFTLVGKYLVLLFYEDKYEVLNPQAEEDPLIKISNEIDEKLSGDVA